MVQPRSRPKGTAITLRPALSWAALLVACSGRPSPVPDDQARAVPLEDVPLAELTLPPHSQPSDAPISERIAVQGPWRRVTEGDRTGWATDLPIRPRGLFFFRAEAGMELLGPDGPLRYDREWEHDRDTLTVYADEAPGSLSLVYPKAAERERALNLAYSGEEPAAFAWTTIQDGWDARRGLLLPAPAAASWDVEVPPAAELRFTGGIVPPELGAADTSDGASVAVTVEVDGERHGVWRGDVHPGRFEPQRVDLSDWAGRSVRLRVETSAEGSLVADYVFLAEPVVASRERDPVRVVMVFVDTLRPDHTSLYGYERDTTAAIDHLADEAAVFTSAYSVSPWTLPAARSIVTGRHPEHYATGPTLQGILGDRGWASAFFAGNVYLSTNFDMERDWDLHRVGGVFPSADEVTDDALRWLDEQEGRDAIVQVHYMDTHLPYHEPRSYRRQYAADAPEGLGERFSLPDVRRSGAMKDEAAQQYIRDRYDNNVRFATDQIRRLVDTLDDNDVLLLFADHGEEFWDHGQYEHGHSLYDELVRVPLVIRAPGIEPGRVAAPVSLIDLAPTVLDLVGEPIPEGTEGWSLVPLMRGEPEAEQRFRDRPVAFGRPLYGLERWGVRKGDDKWSTIEGREAMYDLSTDPGEQQNLLINDVTDAGAPLRDALANALGREVVVGYRLTPSQFKSAADWGTWVLCSVPGGFSWAWPGEDPLLNSFATVRHVEEPAEIERLLAERQITDHEVDPTATGVEICWPGDYKGSREVYLVPNRPLLDIGYEMKCSGFLGDAEGGKRGTMQISKRRYPALGANRVPFNRLMWDQRQVLWQFGISPVPVGGGVVGRDSETEGMLAALGYVDPERDRPMVQEGATPTALGCEPPRVELPPLTPIEPVRAPPGAPPLRAHGESQEGAAEAGTTPAPAAAP
jgi:arylsulfatase A-like enzyme